ncbi:MAG: MGMT family protein [Gammaproteobacteria bacterium]
MSREDEERVRRVVSLIPPGRVATYGQVAREAGLGRRAFPPDTESYHRQRARLEEEGVSFTGHRVDLGHHGWRATLDELLWGP